MSYTDQVIESLKKNIDSFKKEIDTTEIGTVISVGDGIARISGLDNCKAQEMLEFPGGTYGVALNLEEETVGSVILGDFKHIKEGDIVKRSGRIMSVPVGDKLIGRVVNAVGVAIDGGDEIKTKEFYPV